MADGGSKGWGHLLSLRHAVVRVGWARLLAPGSEGPKGFRSQQRGSGRREQHRRQCMMGRSDEWWHRREGTVCYRCFVWRKKKT